MAPVDGDDSILIPCGTLRAMVGAVKHAVAAITEQRVALTGIRLFTSPDGLTMEACDGVRLARAQAPATWTNDIDCVVPAAGKAEEGSYAYNAAHLMTAVAAVKDAQAGLVFSPKTKMLCVQADMEDVRYRAIVMPVRVEGVA